MTAKIVKVFWHTRIIRSFLDTKLRNHLISYPLLV